MERRDAMDARATLIVLVLCALWGGNQVAIKLSNAGTSPIFGSAVRSVVAGALVALWAAVRGRFSGSAFIALRKNASRAGGRPCAFRLGSSKLMDILAISIPAPVPSKGRAPVNIS